MKIAIQTLPLHTNYGGILQAYALQTTLQRMGHEAYVIDKSREPKTLPPVRHVLSFTKRCVKRYILGDKSTVLNPKAQWKLEYPIISQNTQPFIDKYINSLHCKEYTDLPKNCVDAIVVGSDQVWRPKYFGNIADAYLAFAQNWDIKRIAYAASFGTDEWEYTKSQTVACRELISKFDAVSVREDSAVKLYKERFGIDAQHVLDPTMLLNMEDYIELVNKAETPKSTGNLLVYILDDSSDKSKVVNKIAKQKGLTPFSVNSKIGDMNAPVEERIQPPVELWLRGFMDAEFIVTDSFHACVFSIIFHKPFIAYGNTERGAARFHSLLSMFGLESQFISSSESLEFERCSCIDWDKVNIRYEKIKSVSYDFLRLNM
ncbi:MAG: polysaccharide pyruvyl transferase family protein [Rikenellaceae bacterium]